MLLLAPRSHWWVVRAYSPLRLHNARSTQGIFSGIYRQILKISPEAYIFSKALFEGLLFGGAYIQMGMYGGKFVFQNQLGYNPCQKS